MTARRVAADGACDRPNVVLLVMDTARARDVLGRRDVMPNVHRLAAEGVTYTRAFSTAPWTLPSHACLFTGQYTADHGTHAGSKSFDPAVPTLAEVLSEAGYQTAAVSNNTWVSPELGFDRGFEDFAVAWELLDGGADLPTIAAERDGLLDQSLAVGRRLLRLDGHRTLLNALYAKFLRKRFDDGARLTNWRIRRWFRHRRDECRPFFLFVNYLEPHLEYRPPRGYRREFLPPGVDYDRASGLNQDAWTYLAGHDQMTGRDFRTLQGLYRGELRYLDERIGRLYDWLDAADVLADTVVIVVGDHGENIGEHGLMDHQYCLYDTLLHVPLVVRYPEGLRQSVSGGDADCVSATSEAGDPTPERRLSPRGRGVVDDGLVEIRDLYPMLVALAGVDHPSVPTVSEHDPSSEPGREHVLAEYVTPQPSMEVLRERVGDVPAWIHRYDRGLRSVRTGSWKYVEGTDGSRELYALADDPGETENVVEAYDSVAASLEETLHRRRGEISPVERGCDVEFGRDTSERLRDLGYLQ